MIKINRALHAQNTDLYLNTPSNHTLYVDNGRTDSYTEDGSLTKPYKSLQAAHDAVPAGTSASNIYEIRVKLGLPYTGNLTLTKDFITIAGDGGITGAGYSGIITSTSKHLTFRSVNLTSSSTVNQTGVGHFLLEFKECHMGGELNVTASGSDTEKGDSYIQVTGDDNLWMGCTINISGIRGFAGMTGGAYVGNTITVTDSYFCPGCSCVDGNTVYLKAGTTAEFISMYAVRNKIHLETDATLYADILALLNTGDSSVDNTLYAEGGDLIRVSDAQIMVAVETETINSPHINEAVAVTATSTEINKLDGIDTNANSAIAQIIEADIAVTDSAKALFTIPNGAKLYSMTIYATTGFNGTTPTYDIGFAADPDAIIDGISLPSAAGLASGTYGTTATVGQWVNGVTSGAIIGTFIGGGSNTTGAGKVRIAYWA